MIKRAPSRQLMLALLFTTGIAATAGAQSPEPFQGKTISVYIGFGPGGSYDFYSRLIARYLGQHIPGQPNVIAVSMPGAGSFTCANFLFSAAPRDGTAIAMITQTAAIEEALKSPGVLYKSAQFNWVGRITSSVEKQFTYGASKTKTMEDATRNDTVMGTTGAGSPSEGYPKLLNALYRTKFKLVGPYPNTTDAMLAAERGEVEGTLTTYQTIRTARPDWVRDKKVNVLVQYSAKRTTELPDVPAFPEFARDDMGRQMLEFYVSAEQVGRSVVAPPGVSAQRMAILRTAFMETMKDPGLHAEIEMARAEFNPMSGADLQKVIETVATVSPEVVSRMQAVLR